MGMHIGRWGDSTVAEAHWPMRLSRRRRLKAVHCQPDQEISMRTLKSSCGIVLAVAAVAATMALGAHAEYRCAKPEQLSAPERRACALAQQDTPDALIHFVNRTKSIYSLYLDDFVSTADVERWDLAREHKGAESITKADDRASRNEGGR